jgi:hypothetical protein
MHAIHTASTTGEHVVLESHVARPTPIPAGMDFNVLEN